MLPNHAPLMVAEQFGTLETLYPGRIDLGVGRAPGTDMATVRALRRDADRDEDFPRMVDELLAFLEPAGEGQRLRAIPGEGTRVPVWLLGSSTFSAQLAARLGLPFGFASHFAPALLHDALKLYRAQFRSSRSLDKPYVMAGVPVVAASTDAEAARLATSPLQRFLSLMRGAGVYTPPPVDSMDGLWSAGERYVVESKMAASVVGGVETVRARLQEFVSETGVDEVIFTSDIFDHEARLRSFEIAAEASRRIEGNA